MTNYNELKELREKFLADRKAACEERIKAILESLAATLVGAVKDGKAHFTLVFLDSRNSTASQGVVFLELQTVSETVWNSGVVAEEELRLASELFDSSLKAMGFQEVEGNSKYTLDLPDDQ